MNIILGDHNAECVRDKYILLELDLFQIGDNPEVVTAYCVLEDTPLQDLISLQQFLDLHSNLIKNYRLGNFGFCQQALDHLIGKWGGQMDSFYNDLRQRITVIQSKDLKFDPVIHRQ